jgi:hypothetical protein
MSEASTPYYRLRVVSHDVACEIRVNDVPVLRLPGGRVETAFDVNPCVHTGTNSLGLQVRAAEGKPGFGALSACSIELGVKASLRDDQITSIASLRFQAPAGGPGGFEGSGTPAVSQIGLAATQSFALDTPFGPWFWTAAPQIPATEATRAELLAAYHRIHALLAARDVNALMRACDDQARDWQVAYGLPDLASAHRMLGIAATLADPDIAVEAFPEDALSMELLGDQRLAQLVDAHGKSPLRLRLNSSDAVLGRFNVILCRPGSSFVIAR